MIVVRSETHRRHHSLELDGATIVPSWESPDRAEHVDRALDEAGPHETIGPEAFDAELAMRSMTPTTFAFSPRLGLAGRPRAIGQRGRWRSVGPRRFRDVRPTTLEAQLGYYSFAADCSISDGTWGPATALRSPTPRPSGSWPVRRWCSLALGPGPPCDEGPIRGYCYLNNAAIAPSGSVPADMGKSRSSTSTTTMETERRTSSMSATTCGCAVSTAILWRSSLLLGPRRRARRRSGRRTQPQPPPPGNRGETWFDTLDHAIDWLSTSSLGTRRFARTRHLVDDPISHFRLEQPDFMRLGQRLAAIELPTVLVMEGGYATEELGRNVPPCSQASRPFEAPS